MNDKTINERAQYLLKVLIERYIRDGLPVGSKTLAEDVGLPLSPATIRNVLADLEEKGFLTSPHPSAGRVPTALGYRLFVDNLVTIKPLDNQTVEMFQQQLNPDLAVNHLLTSASELLAGITRLAGLVTVPRRERISLEHIEFLPLSDNRILVILVLSDREVQNRIIYTDRLYPRNELQMASNYLNSLFSGKDLLTIRAEVLNAMQQDRLHMDKLMQTAIEVAEKIFDETREDNYVLSGQTHLFDIPDTNHIDRLRLLFEAFTQKRDILHLLDKCLSAHGVQIFIGEESGNSVLNDCSIVTAPYSVEDEVIGVLAVIGPTRMAYDRVIPIVDITAKLLGAALNLPPSSPNINHQSD